MDCTSESSVSIGGASAFTNCNNLQHLIIRSASVSALSNTTYLPPPIQNGNGAIYVPAELVESYKSSTNWSAFKKQIFPIESYPITNFDFSIQDSWATIQANCEAGNTDSYEIGDYKNVDMGSYGTIKFEIIAKDLDVLTDENGDASFDFRHTHRIE